MRGRARTALAVGVPAALLAGGIAVGRVYSSEWRWFSPLLPEVSALTQLGPVRAFPRTEAVLALLEAERHMAENRPYSAWNVLREHIDVPGPTGPAVNLAAARAAAEWGGWSDVRRVLADRPWLGSTSAGDGLFLLARAEEELGNDAAAVAAFRAYVRVDGARNRGVARARLAGLLARSGRHGEAAEEYAAAVAYAPEVADWLRVQQMEQLVAAGDPAAAEVARQITPLSAPVRRKRALLEAQDLIFSAQTDRAIERLGLEARILAAEGARTEAAELNLERARLLLETGDVEGARDQLREVAADRAVAAATRRIAADRLGEFTATTIDAELARAEAYQAAGEPALAARSLTTALEMGSPDGAAQRLRLAQLYYEGRDYSRARAAFRYAAELQTDPESRAYAELYAARSLFRTGGTRARQDALEEFRTIAGRHAGTAAAGTALFLLGDEATTTQTGLSYYRRAAEVVHSPDAREALYRVGDRSLKLNDRAGAIRAWREYVQRYPRGDQSAEVAYQLGKLLSASGQSADARAMYEAAMLAEPTSYWAVRAAQRLGVTPVTTVLSGPEPWVGLASDPAEAAAVLRRMDELEALGLNEARAAEYQSALRRLDSKPLALLVLAEGIRDRNDPVEGIRLGRQLLERRGGKWDERLLRLVYPFPYRDLLIAEARREGIDPYLYAGLVRQESTFRPAIKSRVGATGLGQIMPATGRWLATALGISDYRDELLTVPEVNLRMGTKYLGDLLDRYGGAADLALAGYNAGPSRADRWRREFNYGRDIDAFRAAIPFAETKGYVMVVLRNAEIYRQLYGSSRGGETLATAD